MSLLRLLTAGKSLVGLKNREGRYHLPGDRCMPRFGSKKNPFRATVFPEKTEAAPRGQDQGSESAPVSPEPLKQVENESQPTPPSQEKSVVPDSGACSAAQESKVEIQAPRRSGLRALLLWRRAKKSNSPGLFGGRPMVQGELSLDMVKVVRNDLSESDLEVVQAEAHARKSEKERGRALASERGDSGEKYYAAGLAVAGKS